MLAALAKEKNNQGPTQEAAAPDAEAMEEPTAEDVGELGENEEEEQMDNDEPVDAA